MKRIITLIFAVLFTVAGTLADTERHPKGLYRLKTFIYEDGRQRVPSFFQYKYAANDVGLLIFYRQTANGNDWNNMTVEVREQYPLKSTGETPQGDDGHGTQIFNVEDGHFSFKWYNSQWPNMSPLGQFITEVYSKDDIQDEVRRAIDMLEGRIDTTANRLSGWWTCTSNNAGQGTFWKVYTPEMSMVVRPGNNGIAINCFVTKNISFEGDSLLKETTNTCHIEWSEDGSHTLTFSPDGTHTQTENWVRGGLPMTWQKVFGSSISIYKPPVQRAIDLYMEKSYKECVALCDKELNTPADSEDADGSARFNAHLLRLFRAVAIYRSGEVELGRKLLDDQLNFVNSEIERYETVNGMGQYIYALYSCNMMAYSLAYDIIGADRTLLYLDALTIMAPQVAKQNAIGVKECRGRCYLLLGSKDSAQKQWQQIKEADPNYFKDKPADDPLKQEFGD